MIKSFFLTVGKALPIGSLLLTSCDRKGETEKQTEENNDTEENGNIAETDVDAESETETYAETAAETQLKTHAPVLGGDRKTGHKKAAMD